MAILLHVRDVDERVRDELKAWAAAEGKSLNAYLKALLEESVAAPSRSEVFGRIRARTEATSSTEAIRPLITRDQRPTASARRRVQVQAV